MQPVVMVDSLQDVTAQVVHFNTLGRPRLWCEILCRAEHCNGDLGLGYLPCRQQRVGQGPDQELVVGIPASEVRSGFDHGARPTE
jgi:hypothetical protein